PRTGETDGTVTLFYGALNREEDWPPLLPALQRVVARYPGRLRFRVLHDRQFFDALPSPAKEFEPWVPYERYTEILRQCDIGLLPLGETDFNRMKSDLKFLECAAHGVVALASPTVYAGSIREGETGVIYRSVEEFELRLCELIEQPHRRRQIAANAYQWVAR